MADIWKEDIQRIVTVNASGSGAMAVTLSYPKAFQFIDARLHINVAPTTEENLTIAQDAVAGTGFDTILKTIAMAGVTNKVIDDIPLKFQAGDKIVFAWDNTDTKTWGLEYRYRPIG